MRREEWQIGSWGSDVSGQVVAYGHWGRPVLYFPAEGGSAHDAADHGIIHALAPAIEAGRIKVYSVDSRDHDSWSNPSIPLEERARHHDAWFHWITDGVVPAIHRDCGGGASIVTAGTSMGAYHAVNSALRRADLFSHAVGMSGNYDPSTWHTWGEQGMALYFNNPLAYVPNLHGEHLDWLRGHVFIQLAVGRGPWEVESTQALPSTEALAHALREKGIPHNLDVWGTDTPHDWPSWQRMVIKHVATL